MHVFLCLPDCRRRDNEAARLSKQQRELEALAQHELERHKSAVDAKAAASAADLQEQRAAVAAVRAAAAEKSRALDEEARELALQRAELERQLQAFQEQVQMMLLFVACLAAIHKSAGCMLGK